MASTSPLVQELGAGQVHTNLAMSLRELGHDVRLWSPAPMEGGHWTIDPFRLREQWRAFVRSMGPVDVVDCSPFLAGLRGGDGAHWVSRSTQPEMLYALETMRSEGAASVTAALRQTIRAAWAAAIGATFCTGWLASDVIMCHTEAECRRIARVLPMVAGKMTTWDGNPRRRRPCRPRACAPCPNAPVTRRCAAVHLNGRWATHKGTRVLVDFLRGEG